MPGAMPQNYQQSLRERKPLSMRAKVLSGLTAVVVIAALVVLVLTNTGPKTKHGCINTYLPGVIGAQIYSECGADARQTCSTVNESKRQFGSVGVLIVAKACRKGGIPVG